MISSRSSAHAVVLDRAQRQRDLGLRHPEQAQHPLLQRPGAIEHRAQRSGLDGRLPHQPQLARRPREHDDERPVAVRRRHDEAGRGADRLEDRRALRHDRLLAVARPHRLLAVGPPARPVAAQDVEDPLLQRLVEHHRPAGEAGDHVGRQVVRGRPEAARGEDHVDLLAREEVQRRPHVAGPVGHDHDVRQLDAALAQPLRQPRPVAVGDDPRQDLGAGDDDARADGHPHVGRSASGSALGLPPARIS